MILLIKSILIGICSLLPGISGSVIAVSFGIYDRFISCIFDYKNIKNNIRYIMIVIIGIITGIIISSKMMIIFLAYKTIILYLLTGIILSEIPFLIKKVHEKTNEKIMIIPMCFAFLLSLALEIFNSDNTSMNYSVLRYMLGGIFFAFGKVFPGISSSFFLLELGIFDDIIILITNPLLLFKYFYLYFPFILGSIVGFFVFIKLLKYMLNNNYRLTYSVIIGFVFSSIILIISSFSFDLINIFGFLCMITITIILIIIKSRKK